MHLIFYCYSAKIHQNWFSSYAHLYIFVYFKSHTLYATKIKCDYRLVLLQQCSCWMSRKALTESPLSLHDQGTRCSNFLPPATSSFPLSQLLTKGFFWRLRVWASRAWVNAATHASLKPLLLWIHSRTVLTGKARCSLLPTSTSSPKLPLPSVVWTAEELKYSLYAHVSVLCCF